ncbi:GNAT family N-acetyltransferase [Modestobacter sp. I12A-02628]|uniref:GNAT family N-acetyltransferase n=1 Tax=Goekera deserti TaxID=2497753 RepID=A0A7K3WJ24_9ACTN|nr:GNAT family protein [Goekera deserti]MPQ99055.1 GNAT family N-acetyltransferase [Goekera deserti]NDI47389.1 GNAT family N-acetyltransferase [Goekera deserti]NEL55919.1 GNAT family N-acetyltransferase [Goekera deserti]
MIGLALPAPPPADDVVRLRPWRAADVPSLVLAYRDPLVQRFSWRTTPYSDADAQHDLAEHEQARRRGESLACALVDSHDEHRLLGGVALHDVRRDHGRASVGYWLAPGARGRGAATHGVRLLARWALDELGLARLELTCGPDNEASQRVAERCGFTREGVLRSHVPFQGGRRDSVLFSLLPGELR